MVGLVAAEQAAHSTAADQAFHPSRVRSVPVKGSLIPNVTLICSCDRDMGFRNHKSARATARKT